MIYKTLHRRTDNTMVKIKITNNDLQNITHTTKDRATRTTLNIAGVLRKGNHFLLD